MQPVSFYFISVTKLWDMIIGLRMCKGRMGHANVLDSNSHWLKTNELDIGLPVSVKLENWNTIRDETHWQNLGQWRHTSHRWSGQMTTQNGMTDDRHAAFVYWCNLMILCTDLVHMVEMLKIAYARLWKLQRMTWMRTGEEVGRNVSKANVPINMQSITVQKSCNVIGRRDFSLKYRVKWWIRNWEAWKLLHANIYTLKRFIGCH